MIRFSSLPEQKTKRIDAGCRRDLCPSLVNMISDQRLSQYPRSKKTFLQLPDDVIRHTLRFLRTSDIIVFRQAARACRDRIVSELADQHSLLVDISRWATVAFGLCEISSRRMVFPVWVVGKGIWKNSELHRRAEKRIRYWDLRDLYKPSAPDWSLIEKLTVLFPRDSYGGDRVDRAMFGIHDPPRDLVLLCGNLRQCNMVSICSLTFRMCVLNISKWTVWTDLLVVQRTLMKKGQDRPGSFLIKCLRIDEISVLLSDGEILKCLLESEKLERIDIVPSTEEEINETGWKFGSKISEEALSRCRRWKSGVPSALLEHVQWSPPASLTHISGPIEIVKRIKSSKLSSETRLKTLHVWEKGGTENHSLAGKAQVTGLEKKSVSE